MTIPARYSRRKLVISPREALVAGGPAEALERTIQAHLASGRRHIVIDLKAVPHLDSAGIRALIRGLTSAERLGGHLRVTRANEQIRSLLEVTRLDEVFDLKGSAERRWLVPASWATLRLIAAGTILVVVLIWGGARWPAAPSEGQPSQLDQLLGRIPVAGRLLHSEPLLDFSKLVAAATIGLLVTAVQRRLQRDRVHNRSLEHAKVLLTTAGSLMMLIISDNIARAFGIAGAASIVRFRTPIEDPKEITVLFLLMGLGMLTGLGSFAAAGVATAFLCLFLMLLDRFSAPAPRRMMVEITAKGPEFPTAEVETVFAINRIIFERREVSQGEKPTARYYTTLDPKLSLADISEQLVGDGSAGIKSVVWEPPKRSE